MVLAQAHCPFDGSYGQIGFRLCSDGKTIVLMCNECDAVWQNPEKIDLENYVYTSPPDHIIPGTICSVRAPISRWASKKEVVEYGWSNYITGEIPINNT